MDANAALQQPFCPDISWSSSGLFKNENKKTNYNSGSVTRFRLIGVVQ